MEAQRIHLVGVCGIAMGTLALMLKEQGHEVTGSDDNIYPPMSDLLAAGGIDLRGGYDPAQLGDPDRVIIGNVMSRGNPQVEAVLDRRLAYSSMAQALHDYFLAGREVVAVAGTHGKSTTTALLAHIMEEAGLDPSLFVGAAARQGGAGHRLGGGRHFIIEGDEYDSAFFEKVPKFMVYRPQHVILTSLEFDHADIFRDLAEIELWFRRLVNLVPQNGTVVYAAGFPNLAAIAGAARTRALSYGPGDADCTWRVTGVEGDRLRILINLEGAVVETTTVLFGEFNCANITAAAAMAHALGAPLERIAAGIAGFSGIRRRQELIYRRGPVMVYEDFAHHPTAIGGFLAALRERFPERIIRAVYEPRSATSRRSVFQNELPGAFASADDVYLKTPFGGKPIDPGQQLDMDQLVADLRRRGQRAALFDRVEEIIESLAAAVGDGVPQVIAIMSNGGFDGIYTRLARRLDERLGHAPAEPAGADTAR